MVRLHCVNMNHRVSIQETFKPFVFLLWCWPFFSSSTWGSRSLARSDMRTPFFLYLFLSLSICHFALFPLSFYFLLLLITACLQTRMHTIIHTQQVGSVSSIASTGDNK
ncbi:hypothetical protein F5H01DRAFT_351062 [Linnemannia elongata]|nr:hypothetical protein F5H01DRAFT_351062 [Linnemannia elongata]